MTDSLEIARRWVTASEKAVRDGEAMPDIQGWHHVVKNLVERVDRYEKDMPSWAHGTPEDYDHWLRQLTPVDRRLVFYQWIGEQAVTQMLDELTGFLREDPIPAQYKTQIPDIVDEAISHVDPRRGADLAPSVLPKGKHMCDLPHHNHIDGMGYLPTCRLSAPE